MSLTDELAEYAKRRGVDLLGCTSVRPFRVERNAGFDPRRLLPTAKAVVVAACYVYGFEKVEPSLPGRPRGRLGPWTRASLAAWRHGESVVTEFLNQRGFQAVLTNDMPYKMAAVRCGIASYGKNSIVHADGFGSYLELAAVVTDAELDCVDRPVETSDCGDCNACVEACPTGALETPWQLDRARCICAWLWGRPIDRSRRDKVGSYVFRCGYCQDACPKNESLRPRERFPFELEDKADSPELIPLLLGDTEHVRAALPAFVLEAGIDTVRRNVAIALGNSGDPAAVEPLTKALKLPDARTRAAAAWALGRLGGPAARNALRDASEREEDETVRGELAEALRDVG
jgi:epoxyqueuosine reductase